MIPYRRQQIWFWGKKTRLASWEVADDHCLFWIALSNTHWGCMSVASFKSARFLRPHTGKEELGACCNMFVDCKKSLRFEHLASHNASTFFSDSSDWWSFANEKQRWFWGKKIAMAIRGVADDCVSIGLLFLVENWVQLSMCVSCLILKL